MMDFDLDAYIDKKTAELLSHFKDRFIEAQMKQEYDVVSAITKKLQKAKEAKINYKSRKVYAKNTETLKHIVDQDDVFNFVLKIDR